VTGIPCPSCGLTRALAHLERGHVSEALRFHPFVPLVFASALALVALLLVELATHRAVIANPLKSRRGVFILFAVVVAFQVVRTAIFFAHGGWSVFWRENIFARLWALVGTVFC
jgi:glucan phosphoethanolaminetransferase (alkaline phosphatase superfamily)